MSSGGRVGGIAGETGGLRDSVGDGGNLIGLGC